MRRGVMAGDRAAARDIYCQLSLRSSDGCAVRERRCVDFVQVPPCFVFHRIGDVEELTVDENGAGVAGLSTHLGVEWRLIKNQERSFLALHGVDQLRVTMRF